MRASGEPAPGPRTQGDHAAAVQEAETIAGHLGARLHKAILRSSIEKAKQGDLTDLETYLPKARKWLAKERAETQAREAEDRARLRAFAHGKDPTQLAKEHAKLRKEQDRDYRKWGKRRPDERTARKAHLSNKLDWRAREMTRIADAYELLTGERLSR